MQQNKFQRWQVCNCKILWYFVLWFARVLTSYRDHFLNHAGNEIADKLAKEAAEEAENMQEVDTPLTSIDVKRTVRDSCKIKWQNRWEASQRGRHMFEFHPSVVARKIAFGSIPAQRIVTQLRTGYCYLNGYLHAVGLKESPLCTCGEPESVKHFIEDCEQYEEIREKFRSRLFFGTGNSEFSCKLFLEEL